mmetsp:Transcript_116550/g.324024  ORF Transcript_116550/g.324024 Transcript_116550/m.324024 type:complete len:404 (+) Transcript_116550:75-1286(+)
MSLAVPGLRRVAAFLALAHVSASGDADLAGVTLAADDECAGGDACAVELLHLRAIASALPDAAGIAAAASAAQQLAGMATAGDWAMAAAAAASAEQIAASTPETGAGIAAAVAAQALATTYQGQIAWTAHPSKCLAVRGAGKNGARLQLDECDPASEAQNFRWSSSERLIRWSGNPDLCVDVENHEAKRGVVVQLWKCNAFDLFEVEAQGKIRWGFDTTMCIDVKDHKASNGNGIQIWSCQDYNTDQTFSFQAVSAPTGGHAQRVEGADVWGPIVWTNYLSKCLEVLGPPQNGAKVQLWDCIVGSPSQQFQWSGKDMKLRLMEFPEYCLDVRDQVRKAGTPLQIWTCNDFDAFHVSPGGQGKITWGHDQSLCIDVRDHKTTNGAGVQVWTCQDYNADQSFNFR